MIFLGLLVVAFLSTWLLPTNYGGRSLKTSARRAMGIAFILAGVSHFVMVDAFRAHLPPLVPGRDLIVYASGVIEIASGIALLVHRYAERIGQAVAAYLLLVFPANVYVALADVDVPGSPDGWYHWARLPFQALFIWWVLRSTRAAEPLANHNAERGRPGTASSTLRDGLPYRP